MDKEDLAVRLWEAAGARRADRRSYEWKVTLGLWAGLLAVAKLAIDSKDLSLANHRGGVILLCILLVTVVTGHCLYEFAFVVPANRRDLEEARQLEDALRTCKELPEAQPINTPWLQRFVPAGFQVGVTLLLAVVAAGSIAV